MSTINFKYSILVLLVFTFFINDIIGQDTLDVAPLNDEGEYNLVPTIWGDTTETGERANMNRVYRLQRGGIYIMDQTIYADFPIRLVADSDDQSKRPPMLVRGKYTSGHNIKTFFTFTKDGLSHSFEDIIFNGVDVERLYYNQWNRGLKISGDDIKVTLDRCIMSYWAGLFLEVTGDDASLIIRDSKWRNGVSAQAPPWGAQQNVFFTKYADTIIFTNNTFFNTGGFCLDFENPTIANYIKIEHNTFFTSSIDLLRMRDMVNTVFRSNLFYATHSYGQSESERKASWFDKDGEIISLFSIDTTGVDLLNSVGLTEKDKNVVVSNNTFFFPQKLKDWWEGFGGINTPVWMNNRTKAMFADDTNYPKLQDYDNDELDPGFVQSDMVDWVIGELVTYNDRVRKKASVVDLKYSRNYDTHTGTSDLLIGFPWPLPESLVYNNQNMLTGGHDGLPIGDLNWFPDSRKEYGVGVDDIPNDLFRDIDCYPNPVTDIANITFDLLQSSKISMKLLDINGNLVKKLVEGVYTKGIHDIELDVSKLNTGVYLYTITNGLSSKSKKLIIIK